MGGLPLQPNAAVKARNPHIYGENTERVIDANAVDDESQLHNDIIEYCKNQRPPWIYFHGSMAVKTSRTKGENDFHILANHGRVFFIECKSKTGKISADQRDIIHWANLLGHMIHVVRSIEEFKAVVEGMDFPRKAEPTSDGKP